MQQRPTTTTSSTRAQEENSIMMMMMMKVTQPIQQQESKLYSSRNSSSIFLAMDDESDQLPLYFRSSSNHFKKSAISAKLVHAIPFVVLLCLFILWWFSCPVNLVVKDSKIVAIDRVEMPQNLNNNPVELAILASATSPVAGVPDQNRAMQNNEMEAHPVSKVD